MLPKAESIQYQVDSITFNFHPWKRSMSGEIKIAYNLPRPEAEQLLSMLILVRMGEDSSNRKVDTASSTGWMSAHRLALV